MEKNTLINHHIGLDYNCNHNDSDDINFYLLSLDLSKDDKKQK